MTLKEFRLHSIIGLGYGTASYEYYRKVFIEQHLDYEPAMEVATADLVIPLLQNNLGVGFVPEPLAAPFLKRQSRSADLKCASTVPRSKNAVGQKPQSEPGYRYFLQLSAGMLSA